MKAWIAVAVALVAAIASGAALADGNELLKHCQVAVRNMEAGVGGNYDTGMCFGIVQGVTESILILNGNLPKDLKFCLPVGAEGVSRGQSVRIITKFLRDNPKLLNEHDSLLIMMAYKQAYPCKG
jgi:Rap1a immunity proteins